MRCCKHPYLIKDPRKHHNHSHHHFDATKNGDIKNNKDENKKKSFIKKENANSENIDNEKKKTIVRNTRSVLEEMNKDSESKDKNDKESEKRDKNDEEGEKNDKREEYDEEGLVTCCGKLQLLDRMLAKMKIRGHRVSCLCFSIASYSPSKASRF